MKEFKLGIIGGMGPAAGNQFAEAIVRGRIVKADQDHIPYVLISASKTPDRTAYLKGQGPSPVPNILKAIKEAKSAGATLACIVCNTSHAPKILNQITAKSKLPIISLVLTTTDYIKKIVPQGSKIGVLATDGTVLGKTFSNALSTAGLVAVYPEAASQSEVMSIIYDTKKYGPKAEIKKRLAELIATMSKTHDVNYFILGCTELSLFDLNHKGIYCFDPIKITADYINSLISEA